MRGHAAPPSPARGALLALLALAVAAALLLPSARAFTRPDQLEALKALREAALAKGNAAGWAKSLASWTCPTDPSDSDQECDPCSKDWSGNWEHIHCRGSEALWGEGSKGDFDGYITTVHITDQELGGSPPPEFCGLVNLREFDLDGSYFTGPFPQFIIDCLPRLQELDLSYNRFTGPLPADVSKKERLQEIKFEHNNFMGTIPASYGDMPHLRSLRLEYNHLTGSVPASFANLADTLNILELAHNDLQGDLSPLAQARPMQVTVSHNPRLCGMVPTGIRFAHGYNPDGTRLGQPCD